MAWFSYGTADSWDRGCAQMFLVHGHDNEVDIVGPSYSDWPCGRETAIP